MPRPGTPVPGPQVTIPQGMEWLLQECLRVVGLRDKIDMGSAMKIYMLTFLVSAIAALSHLNLGRKSPGREA
jgi:hypothetical protein